MTFDSLPRKIGVAAITGYQKHFSPHKGFSCAHRLLYGGESCSQYIKRVLATEGFKAALVNSRQRFKACKQANQILRMRRVRSQNMASSDTESIEPPEEQQTTASSSTKKRKNSSFCSNTTNWGDCCLDGGSNCPDISTVIIDCASIDCGNCSDFDCSSLDCSNFDCSSMDCNFLDCGSCGS
ncbi:MAG TPA: membrane protein insertion efficiency factor YidD [Nostocaceae cyanobacterium]|nr:membrane protein insertion efficiency factor YidD [Nostocaceae cyanobacterium]